MNRNIDLADTPSIDHMLVWTKLATVSRLGRFRRSVKLGPAITFVSRTFKKEGPKLSNDKFLRVLLWQKLKHLHNFLPDQRLKKTLESIRKLRRQRLMHLHDFLFPTRILRVADGRKDFARGVVQETSNRIPEDSEQIVDVPHEIM